MTQTTESFSPQSNSSRIQIEVRDIPEIAPKTAQSQYSGDSDGGDIRHSGDSDGGDVRHSW